MTLWTAYTMQHFKKISCTHDSSKIQLGQNCKTAIEIARSERNLIQVFAAFFVPGLDGLDGITPHAKIIKSTHNTCMLLNLQFQIHQYKFFEIHQKVLILNSLILMACIKPEKNKTIFFCCLLLVVLSLSALSAYGLLISLGIIQFLLPGLLL